MTNKPASSTASINTSRKAQRLYAYFFGVVFIIAILVLAVTLPDPTIFQYTIFRIVISLAAAGVAVMIPGFIEIEINKWLRAGGAIAVFVLIYLYNPASLVNKDNPKDKIEKAAVVKP